ncbi:MAG: 4-hydroxy-tetrahydrodipicolinate reductase, partial [Atribacterota bacterium]|nr:4-hydroxy-tetrahydrodipicolinate reductase [Atribacterota bacterium]
METIRVLVAGAVGKMGKEVVRALSKEDDIQLVGAYDQKECGKDVGVLAGIGETGVIVESNLEKIIQEKNPQLVCDFTHAEALRQNLSRFLLHNLHLVIGTTGLSLTELEQLQKDCEARKIGCMVAPNFALGAVLMMHFARLAARYFKYAEIIEYHHPQKKDAPSGTALKTAEGMEKEGILLQDKGQELVAGARGGQYHGLCIHSVRLPGFVAHQEVIFGGEGQILTIRHDSLDRSSFMPGV